MKSGSKQMIEISTPGSLANGGALKSSTRPEMFAKWTSSMKNRKVTNDFGMKYRYSWRLNICTSVLT